MNFKQKVVQGLFWSIVQSWGRQAISVIIFAVLARLVGPSAFGQIALVGVFISFIQVFIDQGFPIAIIQRDNLESEHLDTAFWTNVGISSLLTVIGILGAPLIAEGFKEPQITPIIQYLSLGFIINAFSSVPQAILNRNLEFRPLALRALTAILVGGILGIFMAFQGFGVWSLVGKQLAEGVIGAIALWWASDWKPKLRFSIQHFKDLFLFGSHIVLTNIFEFFNRQSDNLLIGYFLGTTALGYYTIAYRILMIITSLLTGVVNQVTMPAFSRLQREIEHLQSSFYKATQFVSIVAFPIFTAIAILSPELISVFFGKEWLPSVPVLQALSFVGAQHSISYLYTDVILAMGKSSWRLKLNCLNAITNVLVFAFTVQWGYLAVAIGLAIQACFIATPLFLLAVKKLIHIQLKTYLFQFFSPILSSIIMAASVLFMKKYFIMQNQNTLISLCIVCIFGAIIYIISISTLNFKTFRKGLQNIKYLKI
jgi:O-antigen/teichoic acid export membrane protein